jgi:hypothetical protein
LTRMHSPMRVAMLQCSTVGVNCTLGRGGGGGMEAGWVEWSRGGQQRGLAAQAGCRHRLHVHCA